MSQEAISFKNKNPKIDYKSMKLLELQKLPPHNGIIDFHISKTSFKMLNILNDDSSVVKYFWHGTHDLDSLDLWYNISKEEGILIDVGAHTGLYTMTSVKANNKNKVISIEPYYLNMARLICNLRLNGIGSSVQTMMMAASEVSGTMNFNINTNTSYLSKGGKIAKEGLPIQTIFLDSLNFKNVESKITGIKIDTEGEDLKVLKGSLKLIKENFPQVIIEIRNENKQEIQEIFSDLNYKLYAVNNLSEKINLNKTDISNVLNIYAKPQHID